MGPPSAPTSPTATLPPDATLRTLLEPSTLPRGLLMPRLSPRPSMATPTLATWATLVLLDTLEPTADMLESTLDMLDMLESTLPLLSLLPTLPPPLLPPTLPPSPPMLESAPASATLAVSATLASATLASATLASATVEPWDTAAGRYPDPLRTHTPNPIVTCVFTGSVLMLPRFWLQNIVRRMRI